MSELANSYVVIGAMAALRERGNPDLDYFGGQIGFVDKILAGAHLLGKVEESFADSVGVWCYEVAEIFGTAYAHTLLRAASWPLAVDVRQILRDVLRKTSMERRQIEAMLQLVFCDIKPFHRYEIRLCYEFAHESGSYIEPASDSSPDAMPGFMGSFWTIYGRHWDEEAQLFLAQAVGDCNTFEAVRELYIRLTGLPIGTEPKDLFELPTGRI